MDNYIGNKQFQVIQTFDNGLQVSQSAGTDVILSLRKSGENASQANISYDGIKVDFNRGVYVSDVYLKTMNSADSVKNAITALQTIVQNADIDLEQTQGYVSTLQNQVDELIAKDLVHDQNDLDNQIAIQQVQTNLTDSNTAQQVINDDIDSFRLTTTGNIQQINDNLTLATDRISANDVAIEDIQTQIDVIDQQIVGIQSDISGHDNRLIIVENFDTEQNLVNQGISLRVEQLEQNAYDWDESRIQNIELAQSGLIVRVTDVEQTQNTQQTAISGVQTIVSTHTQELESIAQTESTHYQAQQTVNSSVDGRLTTIEQNAYDWDPVKIADMDSNILQNQQGITQIGREYEAFYIDNTYGLDTNNGSITKPYKTIQAALDQHNTTFVLYVRTSTTQNVTFRSVNQSIQIVLSAKTQHSGSITYVPGNTSIYWLGRTGWLNGEVNDACSGNIYYDCTVSGNYVKNPVAVSQTPMGYLEFGINSTFDSLNLTLSSNCNVRMLGNGAGMSLTQTNGLFTHQGRGSLISPQISGGANPLVGFPIMLLQGSVQLISNGTNCLRWNTVYGLCYLAQMSSLQLDMTTYGKIDFTGSSITTQLTIYTDCQLTPNGDVYPTNTVFANSAKFLRADNTATNYTATNLSVNGHLTGINTEVGTIKTNITTANTNIASLNNWRTNVDTTLNAYNTSINTLLSDNTSNKSRLTILETDNTANKTNILGLQDTVSGHVTAISSLTTQGNQLMSTQDTQATTISGIQTDLTTLAGRVTTTEGDIATLQGNFTSADNMLLDHESRIAVLEGLPSSWDETRVAAIESVNITQSANITTANTNIASLNNWRTTAEGQITSFGNQLDIINPAITDFEIRITDLEDNPSTWQEQRIVNIETIDTTQNGRLDTLDLGYSSTLSTINDLTKNKQNVNNGIVSGTWTPVITNSDVVVSYLSGNKYNVSGVQYLIISDGNSGNLALSSGMNYIYYNISGVMTISTTRPDYEVSCMLFMIYFNNPNYIIYNEQHPDNMTQGEHKYLHQTQGTKLVSGCVLTLSGALQGNNILLTTTSGILADENLQINVNSIISGGLRVFWQNASVWSWIDSPQTVHYLTNRAYINTSNTLTQITANTQYFNYWLVATTALNSPQLITIMGQAIYTSQALAQAATFQTELGQTVNTLFNEGIVLYRITYRGQTGNTYGCAIWAYTYLGQTLIQNISNNQISLANLPQEVQTAASTIGLLTNGTLPSLTFYKTDATASNALITYNGTTFNFDKQLTITAASSHSYINFSNTGGNGQFYFHTNGEFYMTKNLNLQGNTLYIPLGIMAQFTQDNSHNMLCNGRATNTLTSGSNNTAIGTNAMKDGNNCVNNVVYGTAAGQKITTGSYNTCIGLSAGVGYYTEAAKALTTGQLNTYIGHQTCPSANNVIGESVFGSSTTGDSLIGKGTNTTFIGGQYGCYNQANSSTFATSSDQRIKKNIVPTTYGLAQILQLQVVEFNYKTKAEEPILIPNEYPTALQIGMLAQQVQQIMPDSIRGTLSDTTTIAIDYHEIYMTHVKATQELNAKVVLLEQQIQQSDPYSGTIGECFLAGQYVKPNRGLTHEIKLCDGAAYDPNVYVELFNALGTTQLPNLISSGSLRWYIQTK